jgi:UDP-glucuronate 4-epimerase
MDNYLVSGCAGFIGFHTALSLLKKKKIVFGLDNLNSYYDKALKIERLDKLKKYKNFNFKKLDISKKQILKSYIEKNKINIVVHLAAQAGVRYSFEKPDTYFDSNIKGFYNLLEAIKKKKIKHLVFASTSSVYGNSDKTPFKETHSTDNPVSFYAASKKINEVMAYPYAHNYNVPITALRFFTVYGPYGRPDMSLFKFVDKMLKNKPIELFNNGNHTRDFTYIDDIVASINRVIIKPPKQKIPFRILNVGSNNPKKLKEFINIIEDNLGLKSKKIKTGFQIGDVKSTHANIDNLKKITNYRPATSLISGINSFILWFKKYNKNNEN